MWFLIPIMKLGLKLAVSVSAFRPTIVIFKNDDFN
jgi:hypothetical protein